MNPYSIIGALLFSIALAGGSYYAGWEQRGDHEAAAALELKVKTDAAEKAERDRADGLAADLETEKRNIKTVTVEVIKEVPKVTTVYKETPNAPLQPIPDAIYTYGFVGLWDRALAGGQLSAGAVKPADPAGGSDLLRAPVKSQDILTNAAENFSKYAECRAQLNKLIDFEVGRGGVVRPDDKSPAED